MRICSGAGCMGKCADTARYCDECAIEHQQSDGIRSHTSSDREKYHKLYSGTRWKTQTQPTVLRRDPFCKRCERVVSELVDHIVPAGVAVAQVLLSGRYPFNPVAGFYLLSNLCGLCRSCHAVKTNEDKRHVGPWPSVLEKEDAQPKKVYSF
jgi:5-methylcytosine-specific restriction endonuclease McrA